MASTLFTYIPTSGNGNTNVSVSTAGGNTGTADKVSTITFTGGGGSKSVTLTQKFKPYITQGPTSFPASGGSITVYVYSEYDIVFRSVPTWITITSGNTTYAEGQRIYANTFGTLPAAFTLTADENTGASRTIQYEGMNVSHYIGNTLVTSGAPTVVGYQESGTPVATWTLANISSYVIDGTISYYQGDFGRFITFNLTSQEEEPETMQTQITIDDIAAVIVPLPQNCQNYDIIFSNSGGGVGMDAIICTYDSNDSAWRGTGTIVVDDGDVVYINVIQSHISSLQSGNDEAEEPEAEE